jgi:hypothetical protein
VRGIFFDEDQARTVVARLVRDGYDATLDRERLAGEDDDEGHPWAVLTDAPAIVLELLVEQFDGWLDEDDVPTPDPRAGGGLPPVELPTAPKRIKRP